MDVLSIPGLPALTKNSSVSVISEVLDLQQKYPVNVSPWPGYEYKPEVSFAIAHAGDILFLKYYVTEQHVLAVNRLSNGPVYHDSCVEFFISWGHDKSYYNLEFNCAGTCNFGYGSTREGRTPIAEKLLAKVQYQTVFKSVKSDVHWELTLSIPVEIFSHHQIRSVNEKQCRVNFYKCGDMLIEPHYLSWTDIGSAGPNFHLPDFFANAYFQRLEIMKSKPALNSIY